MAMLNSLKDSMEHAQTPEERRAIYIEMRKAADQFKAETQRIRSDRRNRSSSQREQSGGASAEAQDRSPQAAGAAAASPASPASAVGSPLRGVQFPVFLYDSERFAQQEGQSVSEDRIECAICICAYEELEEVMVLPCLHWFHAHCGNQWLTKRTECPLCQFDVAQILRDGVQVDGLRLR
jgi:hypothetical protein